MRCYRSTRGGSGSSLPPPSTSLSSPTATVRCSPSLSSAQLAGRHLAQRWQRHVAQPTAVFAGGVSTCELLEETKERSLNLLRGISFTDSVHGRRAEVRPAPAVNPPATSPAHAAAGTASLFRHAVLSAGLAEAEPCAEGVLLPQRDQLGDEPQTARRAVGAHPAPLTPSHHCRSDSILARATLVFASDRRSAAIAEPRDGWGG